MSQLSAVVYTAPLYMQVGITILPIYSQSCQMLSIQKTSMSLTSEKVKENGQPTRVQYFITNEWAFQTLGYTGAKWTYFPVF